MSTTRRETVAETSGSTNARGLPRVDLNPMFRAGILAVTSNPIVSRAVRRYGMRLGASRFVAGETFAEAIPVLRSLNQCGLRTNTTLLGEGVKDRATTRAVVNEYKADLDRIAAESLQTNIALKLTHLGLDLDPELAYGNVADVVAHTAMHGNFVRIDMEESARVDDTLRVYRRLPAQGGRRPRLHRTSGTDVGRERLHRDRHA